MNIVTDTSIPKTTISGDGPFKVITLEGQAALDYEDAQPKRRDMQATEHLAQQWFTDFEAGTTFTTIAERDNFANNVVAYNVYKVGYKSYKRLYEEQLLINQQLSKQVALLKELIKRQ